MYPRHTPWHQLTNRLGDPDTFMDGNSVSTGLRGAYQGLATSSYWISTGSMSTGNSGITFCAQKLWHACEGRERCAQLLQKGKNRFTVAKGLARGWCFKWQGSGETLHPCRSLEAIADIQIQAGSLEKGVGARVSSATACHKAHQPITVPKEDQCAPSWQQKHLRGDLGQTTAGRLCPQCLVPM